ncbi:MAG: DUF805 domain-containing protein [Methylococcaceae bacterium]
MNWYLEVLKKYAVFDGRARRKEYWYFTLFNFLAFFIVTFIDSAIGSFNYEVGIGLFGGIYSLAVLIPAIAVSVRRLHDTNRSGWWLLIELIPVIGAIVLLIFLVQDSQQGDNQYGPNPKPDDKGGSNLAIVVTVVIVTMSVIGILAAIAIPAYQDYVERAKQTGFHHNSN